jgi:hypothetical protein
MSKKDQEHFLEGYIAYMNGKAIASCTYKLDSREYASWMRGWYRGRIEGATYSVSIKPQDDLA